MCQLAGCQPRTMPALEGTPAFSGCAHPAARHAHTAHAGLVLLGMASAVSLLIRHWRSIEAAAAPADQLQKDAALLDEPLLVSRGVTKRYVEQEWVLLVVDVDRCFALDQGDDAELEGGSPVSGGSRWGGSGRHEADTLEGGSPQGGSPQGGGLSHVGSFGALLAISPLDFFKSVSDGETTLLLDRHSHPAGGTLLECRINVRLCTSRTYHACCAAAQSNSGLDSGLPGPTVLWASAQARHRGILMKMLAAAMAIATVRHESNGVSIHSRCDLLTRRGQRARGRRVAGHRAGREGRPWQPQPGGLRCWTLPEMRSSAPRRC